MSKPNCQELVNLYLMMGMTARYVNEHTYPIGLKELDVNTVLVYVHDTGEDIILIGDNLIDLVRFKFRKDGGPVRGR